MNIVLTFDNNYSPYAAALIASICTYNKVANFYIISDFISMDNQEKLKQLCSEYSVKINIISVDKDVMKQFPIGKGTANTYVSLATYYRLFIPQLLPADIDRVLYIDCDTIVRGSLTDLWNYNVKDNTCVVASEEQARLAAEAVARLGYSDDSYFNAGVLLLLIDRLRALDFTSKALSYISENHDVIRFHDQDVLNALLCNNKEYMPLKYNVLDTFLIKGANVPKRYKKSRGDIYNPIVIHFSGPLKPWHIECKHPLKQEFFNYIAKTPYRDFTPWMKNKDLKSKILFLIKNMVKSILESLHIKAYSYINIDAIVNDAYRK